MKKRGFLLKIILSFLFLSFSFLILVYFYLASTLPDPNILGEKIISGGVEIYDRTEKVLLYKIGFRRQWVDYQEIPDKVIKAFLVSEDIDFFKHKGISLRGILRSIYLNLKTGSLTYGGSTITQQLARNLFLSHEKSFIRKLKEIILAIKIESRYSKEEILTYYLNFIYLGEGNIGIGAASDYYFNKKIQTVNWAEAATLAAIAKSPAFYAPTSPENLKRLKERRDFILKKLYENNFISEKEYQNSLQEEIGLVKNKYQGIIAPHFVMEVVNSLKKMFPNQSLEELNLKVITTLDVKIQKIAEEIIQKRAKENKKKYGGANAALMAINPQTGEVLALVGSKDFFDESIDGQVNVPFRPRQPGSAIKPLIYAALFELGYPDKTIVFDVPTDFGNNYRPKNFDNLFKGPVTLRQALAESRNVPSVKVYYLAIPERVENLIKELGIDYLKPINYYGLSFGLGTAEIRMADLIRFYGALANDGVLVSQSLILKIIQRDGEVIYEYFPQEKRIISTETARLVTDILKDKEARRGLFQRSFYLTDFGSDEVALKTGTTQFYQDAWTFGYTKNLAVGVWAGNTSGKRMNSLGASLVAALPIFHDFLVKLQEEGILIENKFDPPEQRIVNKPMLNGNWVSEYGIHDILFYVNRYDPLGPIPENPYQDPQFEKWEIGVQKWLNSF
ncbi:Penicillin-binding protein 1F [bacterium HR35]|nr:Penicillin-binding protein 1F [bacterium HR35]